MKPNQKALNDKVVIISGASRGIGAATAKLFYENGAKLVLGYMNESEEQKKLSEFLQGAFWVQGDISERSTSVLLCNQALDHYGKIDIVIANAGISYFGLFAKTKTEDFDKIVKTNQYGPFFLIQESLKYMKKAKSGCIVTVSSAFASRTPKMNTIYAGTKAFIEAITRGLALEIGQYGIRINSIAPGVTNTEMNRVILSAARESVEKGIALKRIAEPDEIAQAVLYLCSDAASFVNGHILNVDGGETNGL